MVSFKHVVSLLIAIAAFIYTFYAMSKLVFFLSSPRTIHKEYVWILNLLDDRSRVETAAVSIVADAFLLTTFILQHSLMKTNIIKRLFNRIGLGIAQRAIYNLASSYCLVILIDNWIQAPTLSLWQVDVSDSIILYVCFVIPHVLAWTVIYTGCIIMDFPELIGIKQVYYDMNELKPPMSYKSPQLRQLYEHVRHPSFVGFSVMLWVTNIMSLDRLLLAILLTTYMYVSWTTDQNDIIYHRCQLARKRLQLNNQR